MGAWGLKNFENDEAMDFNADVIEGGKSLIKDAILKITESDASVYLEAPDCEIALAAIEYIAAQKGKPSTDFPEDAREWIKNHDLLNFRSGFFFKKKIEITQLSLQAIERIKSHSELRELWEESPEYEDWIKVVEDLRNRVK